MIVLVSVIMPARNADAYIKASIESILNQTYKNIELIVVNDQSTDNTLQVIEEFNDNRLSVVTGPATGISDAFNTGLNAATGRYVCRCDADDLYPQDRIETQVKWLEMHPQYIAVCGMFSSIDKKGRHLVQYNKDSVSMSLDDKYYEGVVMTHFCTFMTQTAVLRKIGGCRSFFVTAEDIDLQFRLSEQGSIYFLALNMYQYRLHQLSITHTQSNTKRMFYERVARDMHQQRQTGNLDDLQKGNAPLIPSSDDGVAHSAENHIQGQLIGESWYWHNKRQRLKALSSACLVARTYPLMCSSWKNLALILIKSINR